MSDTVKVRLATTSATDEGIKITMKTTEGMSVNFLLDDFAVAALALTLKPVMEAALNRQPILFRGEDNK